MKQKLHLPGTARFERIRRVKVFLSFFFIDYAIFSCRILNIYKKAYGEKDGRVGMAMCSLANAKCTKGLVITYIYIYIPPSLFVEDGEFSQQAMQMKRWIFTRRLYVSSKSQIICP